MSVNVQVYPVIPDHSGAAEDKAAYEAEEGLLEEIFG
jgi:hypothetical protein